MKWALLLVAHLLTPQAWPFAFKESEVPWDLTPLIPHAIGPPLPLLTRVDTRLADFGGTLKRMLRSVEVARSSLRD